ncbi:YqgE/AlgH family protein [Pseudopedobacter beijingensis]|uniref:YqgE/AlgH family protein n=1 Tax=Pseudopedobacter beijingensis TaxID=1207056 RepID=A0ABW4IHT5_9SPHI
MLSQITPENGNILIAEPFMLDDNFKRSVVLLVANDEGGRVGYILNQKSGLLVKDLMPNCPDCDFQIYVGGPVSPDTLHFLHSCPEKITGGEEVRENIYWGGSFEMLVDHLVKGDLSENEIKLFMGYSGWNNEQLQDELEINSWIVSDKIDADMVFDSLDIDIWKESIIGLGQKFAHVANFPQRPEWN